MMLDLLKSRLGRQMMGAKEGDTGPILMQPVGGMDKIISGFLNHVGEQVKYRAMVTSVQVTDKGVNVAYIRMVSGTALKWITALTAFRLI